MAPEDRIVDGGEEEEEVKDQVMWINQVDNGPWGGWINQVGKWNTGEARMEKVLRG